MPKSNVIGSGKIILARLRLNWIGLTGVSTVAELFNSNKTETLYLWFLFMNRPDMAKYLCSRCQVRSLFITSFCFSISVLLESDRCYSACSGDLSYSGKEQYKK